MSIAVFIFGLGITVASPVLALQLFVILAPFGIISDFTGVDPRTYWALALALCAAFHQLKYRARIPIRALLVWVAFTSVTGIVLWTRGGAIEAGEFEKASSLFRYFIASSFAAFAIVQLPRTVRDYRRIAHAFIAAVTWVSIVCIAEELLLLHSGSPGRVTGTLGSPNYMAAFLSVSATSLLLLQVRGWVGRRYAYPAVLMGWVACGFTMSRVGWLTAVVGFVLHLTCIAPPGRRMRRLAMGSLVVSVICLSVAGYVTRARAELESPAIDTQQRDAAHLAQAVSDLGRLEAAMYAVKLFRENPVFGVGFATLTARNFDENGIYLTTHDTYLQLLTGSGIVGTLLFAMLILTLMRKVPSEERLLLLPTAGGLGISAFFGDYLQSIEIFVVLAISYAAVWCASSRKCDNLEPNNQQGCTTTS